MREFGLEVGDDVEVRVVDSTADLRYMVLPLRPAGTGQMSEEELVPLVTRDSMIGVGGRQSAHRQQVIGAKQSTVAANGATFHRCGSRVGFVTRCLDGPTSRASTAGVALSLTESYPAPGTFH